MFQEQFQSTHYLQQTFWTDNPKSDGECNTFNSTFIQGLSIASIGALTASNMLGLAAGVIQTFGFSSFNDD